jgi:hypothetical protein
VRLRWIGIILHWLGVVFVAHALMLIGADEISTLENGGIRTIRSLDQILTLYGADLKPWLASWPAVPGDILMIVISWPGWAVFAVLGIILVAVARPSN